MEKDMRTERNNVVVVGGLMMLWLGCLALAIYIEDPKAGFSCLFYLMLKTKNSKNEFFLNYMTWSFGIKQLVNDLSISMDC